MGAVKNGLPESIVFEIKRKAHCKFTAEDKIRIILEGLHASAIKDFSLNSV